MCDRLVVVVCVVFCSLQRSLCSFSLSAPLSSVAVNSLNGEVFVAAGTQLVRLSRDLELLETVVVEGELVRIALSPDGGRLVGCLGGDTRTCLVYDTSNLTSGPSATVEDAHYNPENGLAIVATTDAFYLGSEGDSGLGNDNMFLAQYNYISEVIRTTGTARYRVQDSNFIRQFYGGVSWNNYVYYFVADRGSDYDDIRVLRVCDCARHPCTSEFEALYELSVECRSSATDNTRVCGVDLVESFAGQTGPLVVVTRCEEDTRNRVCAFRLADIDGDMDAYLTGCRSGMHSESDLPWDVQRSCSQFTVSNISLELTFYHHRERILVILEILALLVSMWKRLLNPIHNDLGFIWSILALTSLLPLWPSLLRVSVYYMWPLMEPLNW